MKRYLFILSALLTYALFSGELCAVQMTSPLNRHTSRIAEGPTIAVLIAKNVNSAYLEAKGEYRVISPRTGAYLSSGIAGKKYMVHGMKEGLRWGEEYPEIYQIKVVPTSGETTFFVDGIQYRGELVITQAADTRVTVVNEVKIEDYLRSILAVKVNSPLSQEAMAALAITARTAAMKQAKNRSGVARLWDVTAEAVDYFGEGVCLQNPQIEKALTDTKFMVIQGGVESGEFDDLFIERLQELSSRGYDASEIIGKQFSNAKIVSDYTSPVRPVSRQKQSIR